MKSKALRIGGFVVAVGATASLVGFASQGTGAYFSDATNGNMNVSTGHVKVTSSPSTLDFTNSLPGVYKTQPVTYSVSGDGPEDVYIAFDTYPGDYVVNGFKSDVGGNGENALGRYGHLKVDGPSGTFQSYNLSTDNSQATRGTVSGDPTADCYENPTTGLGGSADQSTRAADPTSPGNGAPSYVNSCPAPQYILLSSGLKSTDGSQTANVTFGYTPIYDNNAQQNSPIGQIPFRIVAEQAGVSPYDTNTTNGH